MQSHFFGGLFAAGGALDLKILALWGMDMKTRLTCSSGAYATLSVLSIAELCPLRHTDLLLILLNQK